MTPAGTSNELDVQNEWEENTHTQPAVVNLENTLLLTIRLITQPAVVNLCTVGHFQIVLVDISNRKGEP